MLSSSSIKVMQMLYRPAWCIISVAAPLWIGTRCLRLSCAPQPYIGSMPQQHTKQTTQFNAYLRVCIRVCAHVLLACCRSLLPSFLTSWSSHCAEQEILFTAYAPHVLSCCSHSSFMDANATNIAYFVLLSHMTSCLLLLCCMHDCSCRHFHASTCYAGCKSISALLDHMPL